MLFVDFFNIKDCFSEFYFLIFRQEGDFEKIEKNIKKCKYFSIFGSKNADLTIRKCFFKQKRKIEQKKRLPFQTASFLNIYGQ